MDLDTADVEDLIGALADRYRRHRITRTQAKLYTVEMLAHAFDELDEFEDRSLVPDIFTTEGAKFARRH